MSLNNRRRLLPICAALLAMPLTVIAGTPQLVRDISVGGNSEPNEFVDFNGQLAFVAYSEATGQELWISDGTAAGTRLLADINPGAAGSFPNHLIVANGALYFMASGGLMRLKSPTAQPEVLLGNAGPQSSFITRACEQPLPVALDNAVYFVARTSTEPLRVLRTDGTAAGTGQILAEFGRPALPCSLTVYKGRLYFAGAGTTVGNIDRELWTSDGTSAGTTRIADLVPGEWSSEPRGFIKFNDLLYFTALVPVNGGYLEHLWRTDGTAAGTFMAAEVARSPQSNIRTRGIVNGKLLIEVVDVDTYSYSNFFARELWVSRGSAADTSFLLQFQSNGGADMLVTPARAYFAAADGPGNEPWITDGTLPGTHLLKDLNPNGDANPTFFADFNGVTLIATSNAAQGSQLWKTDGTSAGTSLISSIPGPPQWRGPPEVRPLVTRQRLTVGQNFFFAATDPVLGEELYVLRNDAPVAGADTASSTTGAAVTVNVLANDTDGDGTLVPQSVRITTQPTHGTVAANADGSLVYTPGAGYSGTDSFSYTVDDNQGATSNAGVVTVNPPPPPPPDTSTGKHGGGPMGALELALLCGLGMLRAAMRGRPGTAH